MIQPKIHISEEKKFVGIKLKMSYADNKTGLLWRSFMPRRHEISHKIGSDLYSLQIYPHSFFDSFDPETEFEKRALVEVSHFDSTPDGMENLTLSSGLYAVFHYVGSSSEAAQIFGYIFYEWLPQSEYVLDNRPHFEVLGEKYKNDDPNSEEEMWIPIKPK